MNMNKYILDGHTPVVEPDLLTWGRWFNDGERRRVADSEPVKGVRVSTVFLGLDHSFGSEGPPLLFETMIFGGEHNDYQDRYATWDEAVAGHAKAVALVLG